MSVPAHLHPTHKARSDTAHISVALSGAPRPWCYVYRLQNARTDRLDLLTGRTIRSKHRPRRSDRNSLEQLADRALYRLVADVAAGLLASDPLRAWALIPLEQERVGKEEDRWLRARFDAALRRVRSELGERAVIRIGADLVPLAAIAYEERTLARLLAPSDVITLAPPGSHALPESVRDDASRWRNVLDALAASRVIGAAELLNGLTAACLTRRIRFGGSKRPGA